MWKEIFCGRWYSRGRNDRVGRMFLEVFMLFVKVGVGRNSMRIELLNSVYEVK